MQKGRNLESDEPMEFSTRLSFQITVKFGHLHRCDKCFASHDVNMLPVARVGLLKTKMPLSL